MRVIRKTKAKRKLLTPQVLANISAKHDFGVPLATIVRQLDLNLSRCALATLLQWYKQMNEDNNVGKQMVIHASLFPDWLDQHDTQVQQNPDGWTYIDRFPLGYWTQNADN